MGKVYKENKNFINKIVSNIKNIGKTSDIRLGRTFLITGVGKEGKKLYHGVTIHMKVSDVEIYEVKDRVYFCVRLKEGSREIRLGYGDKSIEDSAVTSYLDDHYDNKYMGPIRDYLSNKFSKSGEGIPYKDYTESELLEYLNISNAKFDKKELHDYPGVREYYDALVSMIDVDVDYSMDKDVFKQVKDYDVFPIAYVDFVPDGYFYTAKRYHNNPMSVRSVFEGRTFVWAVDSNSMRKQILNGNGIISNVPFNSWVVTESKDPNVRVSK